MVSTRYIDGLMYGTNISFQFVHRYELPNHYQQAFFFFSRIEFLFFHQNMHAFFLFLLRLMVLPSPCRCSPLHLAPAARVSFATPLNPTPAAPCSIALIHASCPPPPSSTLAQSPSERKVHTFPLDATHSLTSLTPLHHPSTACEDLHQTLPLRVQALPLTCRSPYRRRHRHPADLLPWTTWTTWCLACSFWTMRRRTKRRRRRQHRRRPLVPVTAAGSRQTLTPRLHAPCVRQSQRLDHSRPRQRHVPAAWPLATTFVPQFHVHCHLHYLHHHQPRRPCP